MRFTPSTILPFALAMPSPAFAHASDRGFVLLLPTGHYIVGGALAVAISFAVLAFVPTAALAQIWSRRLKLFRLRYEPLVFTSLASFVVLAILVAAGILGSRDPLSNPLPLTVWTLFWIGLTLACGVFGNMWRWVDPWYGVWRVVTWIRGDGASEDSANAGPWSYLPAIIQFAAFAWFELIYPAPDDPYRLAWAVALYWLVTFIAMLIVGHDRWTRTGECFSVFFRIVSKLGLLQRTRDGDVSLGLPGAKLLDTAPLPLSGVVFVLLALGSVSFDGLMRTFRWLGTIGVNPLEFPGRSAVILPNTLGLAGTVALLAAAFVICVRLGEQLSGAPVGLARACGLLVWSIVPIALAYHAAHYLVALLVNGQYALVALSDPFSRGWNLFGTADNYVSAGLVMGPQSAWVLWNLQAVAIVLGHVMAVMVAHLLAIRLYPDPRAATLSQVPLTVLMIGYTIFGLWLLSTPTGA